MNARNPYITGNPVGNTKIFVGREDILQYVIEMVRSDNQNATVLYGQRRIGKTSVLQALESRLKKETSYQVVYFSLEGRASLPLTQLLLILAQTLSNEFNPTGLNTNSIQKQSFKQWFFNWLDNFPTGLVLLLDEFDVLIQPSKIGQATADFFPYFIDDLLPQQKKLKSVFVIGRNINDLTVEAISKFNQFTQKKISLLKPQEIIKLICLENHVLDWKDEAIEKVQKLTNGHPFFIQSLCQQVFDRFYSNKNSNNSIPIVNSKDVEKTIPIVLQTDLNNWEYIWDGLPPSGKVLASALAEEEGRAMTFEALLNRIFGAVGIAIIMRELKEVPKLLQDWDLIELVENEGYRFRVELLRLWIKEYKSLDEVQQELDYINPSAEILYKAGLELYNNQHKQEATDLLRRAIDLNPAHIKANQLLADILCQYQNFVEASKILKEFSKYNPRATKPQLIIVYMALAQKDERDQDKLEFYNKVLKLEPNHSEAKKQKQEISARLEAKHRRLIELVKKIGRDYQKQIAQLIGFFFILGVSSFLPVNFPSNPLFEIEKTDGNNYQLKSIPSSKSHLLAYLQIIITNSNIKPKEDSFKYEDDKQLTFTRLANTETLTYQIDSTSLKEDTFQYPYFEPNKPTPSPFIFTFQFKNNIQNIEFKCKAVDTKKASVGCEVKQSGYFSILRGIPWWMIGTLIGLLWIILVEVFYAWKNRERDDRF
jgi:tetratricopeptide (TPR) repeat protein